MIPEAVRLFREGKANPIPQNDSEASYQPVVKEKDAIIIWERSTQTIYNLIRGSNPSPGATTYLHGEKLKIWEGKPYSAVGTPGKIVKIEAEKGFVVSTGDGAILTQRVQYRDSGKIPAADWVTRYGVMLGDRLGTS
jgi:methionyl-tRNA formyltransferase